jgi:flagellar motor switch protein FliN/FliY
MPPFQEIENFSDLHLEVEAQLDQTIMSLRELMSLVPDHTLKLSRPAGDNIDLLIGGKVICSGEIVIVNDAIGVRITDFREED